MLLSEHKAPVGFDEVSYQVYNLGYQSFADELSSHSLYELVFIVEGRGKWQIGTAYGDFGRSSAFLIGPGLLHSFVLEGSESERAAAWAWVVRFSKKVLPAGLLNLAEAEALQAMLEHANRGIVFSQKDSARIQARIQGLERSKGMLRLARLHVLLDLLATPGKWEVVDNEKETSKLTSREAARLGKAMHYMEAHCAEGIGRDDVAKIVGMEANAFSRFFAKSSGMTFQECLSNLRIQKAVTLLLNRRSLSIELVSKMSGFRNQAAFNRQFKRRLGSTPLAYRKAADLEPLAP